MKNHFFRSFPIILLFGFILFGLSRLTHISAEPTPSKLSSANYPIIRQFGDSITFGYGFVQCYGIPGFCMTTINNGGHIQTCSPCAVQEWGGGYRAWMTALALQPANQFVFGTIGYQCGGSNAIQWSTNSMSHDGYPGFRTDQLAPIASLPSIAAITLVHAGTNDFIQGKTVSSATVNLTNIVMNLINQNPATTIYVAQIVRFMKPASTCPTCKDYTFLNPMVEQYNQWISNQLTKTVIGFPNQIVIVDMYDALTSASDYSFDGVHPSSAGYQKMACSWVRAIKKMPSMPSSPCSDFSLGETKSLSAPLSSEAEKSLAHPEQIQQIMQGKYKGL
ncbi:lipase [Leptospira meyeri]|uniref:GDSL-type esterase/lipase family protein n=1 Tax=Leptospira meyeri TaxID=29508 RepID=UPI000C2AFC4F|nr:GDSL-type esterase/lipase family protein [Leptospira meyeri]PKA12819.1 lipase [Leptospira meyeri]